MPKEESEQRVLAFAEEMVDLYFEQRDYDRLMASVDGDFAMIGMRAAECLESFAEFETLMNTERDEFYACFRVLRKKLDVFTVSDGVFFVSGLLELVEKSDAVGADPIRIRISALVREQEGRLLLWRIHASSVSTVQDVLPEEYGGGIRLTPDDRPVALYAHGVNLRELANNIPGGVLCCRCDKELTLLQLSEGFLSMFGYRRTEIATLFHDSFLMMIHPDDRAVVWKKLCEQLRVGNVEEMEYRAICKNGDMIWIQERGQLVRSEMGEASLYCILLDITGEKNDREMLRLSLERHKIILNQTRDIIFEWDVKRDAILYSANWDEKFGYEPLKNQISTGIRTDRHIHPDDLNCISEMLDQLLGGANYAQAEIRIQSKDEHYIWCRVRASSQYDAEGVLVKVVGVILDIDAEKRTVEHLREKAERDALTGLYNKETARKLIEHALYVNEAEVVNALLLIDVDNFKLVNDRMGHLSGDALLADIAGGLKKLFRSTDVIGRVGGDEFVVFLRNISSDKAALAQAEKIVKLSCNLFQGTREQLAISCSIGIALSSSADMDFQRLYDNADLALYRAKEGGKSRCILYDGERDFERSYVGGSPKTTTEVDSDEMNDGMDNRIVSFLFRALYESHDIDEAINRTLAVIGRRFNVSRVYIFEDAEDGKSCSNTFEWCNNDIPSIRMRLQNVPYHEQLDDYARFNEDGIFYCQDASRLSPTDSVFVKQQALKSILQCVLRDNGKNCGFVGFDECSAQRFWTQEQVDALRLIAEIVCVFLFKQRAKHLPIAQNYQNSEKIFTGEDLTF